MMYIEPGKEGHTVLKRREPAPYYQMNRKRHPPDRTRRRIICTLVILAVLIWAAYLVWGIYSLETGI